MSKSKNDGFKWHKYGEKKLNYRNCVRSYYRCSNKATSCQAKKSIDTRIDNPSSSSVTYFYEHNHGLPKNKKIASKVARVRGSKKASPKVSANTCSQPTTSSSDSKATGFSVDDSELGPCPKASTVWTYKTSPLTADLSEIEMEGLKECFENENSREALKFIDNLLNAPKFNNFSRTEDASVKRDVVIESTSRNFNDPMSFLGGNDSLSIFDFISSN